MYNYRISHSHEINASSVFYLIHFLSNFAKYFHGRNDILDIKTTLKTQMNPYNTTIVLTIGFDEIISSDRIKMFGINHRKCKFLNEFESGISYPLGYYTQNFCMTECRSKIAIKLCGCQPFFYIISNRIQLSH